MKKFILLLLCLVTCAVSATGLVGCEKDTDSQTDSQTKQEDTFTPVSDGGNYTPNGNY